MKKNLWIFAAAAVALAACSNDDTIVVNQGIEEANTISFNSFVTGLTRAADNITPTASTGLEAFGVTARTTDASSPSTYFDNVVFSKVAESANFASATKYYWPSGSNLDFYAYAPVSDDQVVRADSVTFNVTPSTTVASQADFIYGITRSWGKADGATNAIDGTTTGVTLNFCHAESKVDIKLKNTNDNLKITVGNVTIGNIKNSGVFTWNGVTNGTDAIDKKLANTNTGTSNYLNGTWNDIVSPATALTSYTVAMGTDSYNDGTADVTRNVFNGASAADRCLTSTPASHEMILIPQDHTYATVYSGNTVRNGETPGAAFNGAYIKVQLKIQNKENDSYIVGGAGATQYVEAMWPLTACTWIPGHKYTYTVDLAGGGYYPDNNTGDSALDPILKGAEIKFVSVTVDEWADGDATGVYTTGLPE